MAVDQGSGVGVMRKAVVAAVHIVPVGIANAEQMLALVQCFWILPSKLQCLLCCCV